MNKNEKGNAFEGIAGGASYKRGAAVMGINDRFYRKAIGDDIPAKPIKALDLGCGPGALTYALANRVHPGSTLIGVDISESQLQYARANAGQLKCCPQFINCSMDEIKYPDNLFDIVMTSMALHETPPDVRRSTIRETARVLKPGGRFILVDWSKPKFGLYGILWFPFLLGKNQKDNWNNVYKQLCLDQHLTLEEDQYLNSVYRRQVFRK